MKPTIDQRASRIWLIVYLISKEDKEFAKSLINIDSAPLWLRAELDYETVLNEHEQAGMETNSNLEQ